MKTTAGQGTRGLQETAAAAGAICSAADASMTAQGAALEEFKSTMLYSLQQEQATPQCLIFVTAEGASALIPLHNASLLVGAACV